MVHSLCSQPWLLPTDDERQLESLPAHWVTAARLSVVLPDARDWLTKNPGQRYLIYSDRALDFCASLLACWEQGKVAVLPPDDHPATLASLQCNTDQFMPTQLPARGHAAESAPIDVPMLSTLDKSAVALELHTSGSSGRPLKIIKRFFQLDAELSVHAALWPLDGGCVISQVSHLHIYGLLTAILRPLCERVPFSNTQVRFPEILQQHLHEAQQFSLPATVVSSPAQLSRMPEFGLGTDLSPLSRPQRIFSSGAPLAEQDAIRCEALFACELVEIYGSTETGGIAERRQSQTGQWRPLPGVSISVVDDHLCVHSAFLEHPGEPWMQADRICIQGNNFSLLGRHDRIAKIAGKRVSLDSVERVLEDFDSVLQLRCIDLNPRSDRLGMVVAMPRKSLPETLAERRALQRQMLAHLAARADTASLPRYWRLVEHIPLNRQGKPDRQKILRLFDDLYDRNLPRWLGESQPDENTLICQLEVPVRMQSLEGHFDGFPIVPGLVLVQWACDFAAAAFAPLGDFRSLRRLKFQQILQPGERLTLRLERQARYISFSVFSIRGQHCLGQLEFSPHPGLQPDE